MQQIGHQPPSPPLPACLLRAAYSNAGVAAAVALLLVALSNPSMLALPHALALLSTLWRWAGRRQGVAAGSGVGRLLQAYTGACTSRLCCEASLWWSFGRMSSFGDVCCLDCMLRPFIAALWHS